MFLKNFTNIGINAAFPKYSVEPLSDSTDTFNDEFQYRLTPQI